jgi:hypothetical protein
MTPFLLTLGNFGQKREIKPQPKKRQSAPRCSLSLTFAHFRLSPVSIFAHFCSLSLTFSDFPAFFTDSLLIFMPSCFLPDQPLVSKTSEQCQNGKIQ